MENLNLIGLASAFFGSIILGLGMVRTNERIEKESGTYWNGNPYAKQFYYLDRRVGIAGMTLLSIGFLCQLIAAL